MKSEISQMMTDRLDEIVQVFERNMDEHLLPPFTRMSESTSTLESIFLDLESDPGRDRTFFEEAVCKHIDETNLFKGTAKSISAKSASNPEDFSAICAASFKERWHNKFDGLAPRLRKLIHDVG